MAMNEKTYNAYMENKNRIGENPFHSDDIKDVSIQTLRKYDLIRRVEETVKTPLDIEDIVYMLNHQFDEYNPFGDYPEYVNENGIIYEVTIKSYYMWN